GQTRRQSRITMVACGGAMNRLFRVGLLPLLLAAPMAIAGWPPWRFFTDARCLAAFALLVVGLALENAIVSPASVEESKRSAGLDRKSFELELVTNVSCIYLPVYEYLNLPPLIPRSAATVTAGIFLMAAGEGLRIAAL